VIFKRKFVGIEEFSNLEQKYSKLQRRLFVVEQAVEALLERDTSYLSKFPVFNGQVERRKIFESLIESLDFSVAVETGTNWANTTQYLAQSLMDVPVYSGELVRKSFLIARERLKGFANVTILNCDSRDLIRTIIARPNSKQELPFFYLDAHWYDDLPLEEEIDLICENWESFVIMVDDFKVPHDAGYGWDDYNNGKKLDLDYIGPVTSRHNVHIFFPSAKSEQETGAKRGSVVIARGDGILEKLRRNNQLSEYLKVEY